MKEIHLPHVFVEVFVDINKMPMSYLAFELYLIGNQLIILCTSTSVYQHVYFYSRRGTVLISRPNKLINNEIDQGYLNLNHSI